jgi:hypothetical protein
MRIVRARKWRSSLDDVITQLFDGFESTRDHATGALLDLVSAAGLNPLPERGR